MPSRNKPLKMNYHCEVHPQVLTEGLRYSNSLWYEKHWRSNHICMKCQYYWRMGSLQGIELRAPSITKGDKKKENNKDQKKKMKEKKSKNGHSQAKGGLQNWWVTHLVIISFVIYHINTFWNFPKTSTSLCLCTNANKHHKYCRFTARIKKMFMRVC